MARLLTHDMFMRQWPDGKADMINGIIAQQQAAFTQSGLTTDLRIAHFMGQVSVECMDGERFEESLYYSHSRRLMAVYESRFPTVESTLPYLRNPQKLANFVYGNRLGNRPGTDDGYKYRGQGLIQLTGLDNFRTIGFITGLDLVGHPELACDPAHALTVTAAWWSNANLNEIADGDRVLAVTKRVNGGLNALTERRTATQAWKDELGI